MATKRLYQVGTYCSFTFMYAKHVYGGIMATKKKELHELSKELHTTLLEEGMLYELYPLASGNYELDVNSERSVVLRNLYEALREVCDTLECSDEAAVEFLRSDAIEALYEGRMAMKSGMICYINDVKSKFEYK